MHDPVVQKSKKKYKTTFIKKKNNTDKKGVIKCTE